MSKSKDQTETEKYVEYFNSDALQELKQELKDEIKVTIQQDQGVDVINEYQSTIDGWKEQINSGIKSALNFSQNDIADSISNSLEADQTKTVSAVTEKYAKQFISTQQTNIAKILEQYTSKEEITRELTSYFDSLSEKLAENYVDNREKIKEESTKPELPVRGIKIKHWESYIF